MKKEYIIHYATAYNNKENTQLKNYPFKRYCSKDSRIVVGKGKCLKCEYNNGIEKDENGKYVNCSFL